MLKLLSSSSLNSLMSLNNSASFASSASIGAIFINPLTSSPGSEMISWISALKTSLLYPDFCSSPALLTCNKTFSLLFNSQAAFDTARAIFSESIDSITSKCFTTFSALFDCKCPIKWNVEFCLTFSGSFSNFAIASTALDSPKSLIPAS